MIIWLFSSMVEHSADNRTTEVRFLEEPPKFNSYLIFYGPIVLIGKYPPLHGGVRGSNPRGSTNSLI